MSDRKYELKVFIDGHEVMPFDGEISFTIRREPVDKKEIENLIRAKTKAAEEYMEGVKAEVADLADKAGVQAYWGEYGSGETYYPVGTDVEAAYIGWEASQYADENGLLTQGMWISSSSMC